MLKESSAQESTSQELSYKESLFDSLGVANKERIHTQFLYWFLTNRKIEDNIRVCFITGILEKNNSPHLKEFNPEDIIKIEDINTEYENIDLIIEYKIKDKKYVMAFENKLNSTVHSDPGSEYEDQLSKYDDILNKEFPEHGKDKFLLSLIGEMPHGNKGWQVITYKNINDIFSNTIQKKMDSNNNEKIFVDEYIKTLDNLLLAQKRFLENPRKFQKINPIKLKDLEEAHEDMYFISKNKLKKILMINYLMVQFKDITNKFHNHLYAFSETHGAALFQIRIYEREKLPYILQFQYQSYTVKLQILPTEAGKELPESLINGFKTESKTYKTWRINFAQKDKKTTKKKNSYISLSKRLTVEAVDIKYRQHFENVKAEFDNIYNNKDKIIDILLADTIYDKKDQIIKILANV